MSDRFDVLSEKLARLERELERWAEAGPPPDTDLAQMSGEFNKQLEALSFLERRLMKLEQLDRLRAEVAALNARLSAKSEALRKLEAELDRARSELRKSIVISRLEQQALEERTSPRQRALPSFTKQAMKGNGVGPEKDEDLARWLADNVGACLKREAAERRSAGSLRDRVALLRDDILEIEALLELANLRIQLLEQSRNEWDRDEPMRHPDRTDSKSGHKREG